MAPGAKRGPSGPPTLAFGGFTVQVRRVTSGTRKRGRWDDLAGEGVVIGPWTAPSTPDVPRPDGSFRVRQRFEINPRVTDPETQISADLARTLVGERPAVTSVEVTLDVPSADLQRLVSGAPPAADWMAPWITRAGVPVMFRGVRAFDAPEGARVTRGEAWSNAEDVPALWSTPHGDVRLLVDDLRLEALRAWVRARVALPGLFTTPGCAPAIVDLGLVEIPAGTSLRVERPDLHLGPWLLPDPGLILEGKGLTLDLTRAGTGTTPSGIVLHEGLLSGAGYHSPPNNTGWLEATYRFEHAVVHPDGLAAVARSIGAFTFETLQPKGHVVAISDGVVVIRQGRVVGGAFGPATITLPTIAVRGGSGSVVVPFTTLHVQPDLDLAGIEDTDPTAITFGELTHFGVVPWHAEAREALAWYPAGPRRDLQPDAAGPFLDPGLPADPSTALASAAAHGLSGVTFQRVDALTVVSADLRDGPLAVAFPRGWLRVGVLGVDGALATQRPVPMRAGDPTRPVYVGGVPFELTAGEAVPLARWAASAVWDGGMRGSLVIGAPASLDLGFDGLSFTSTGALVGGAVLLPKGARLSAWGLGLVTEPGAPSAGTLSVGTGQILLHAAGVTEEVHFLEPFWLLWGDLRADGSLGPFVFDPDTSGQRFDGVPYQAHGVRLSAPAEAALLTHGTLHFPAFGPAYANIRDAVHGTAGAPWWGRDVRVLDEADGPTARPTDLSLAHVWSGPAGARSGAFTFPGATVAYHVALQSGFVGVGTVELSLLSVPLRGDLLIRPPPGDPTRVVVDIHLSSAFDVSAVVDSHPLLLLEPATGPLPVEVASIGALGSIAGCVRIEGDTLSMISVFAELATQARAGVWIATADAAAAVEVNLTITPSFVDVRLAGDLHLAVVTAQIDASAEVHLRVDLAEASVLGEINGRFGLGTFAAALQAQGQLTWFASPSYAYLQGRVKVELATWVTGLGLEGGLFLGFNVPRDEAWVTATTDPHFDVPRRLLNTHLTGVMCYGLVSMGFNAVIFGGEVSIFAAVGVFVDPTVADPWSFLLGSIPSVMFSVGVYLHGEILGGLVSASGWAQLSVVTALPPRLEGTLGLEGCVMWVACASVELTVGVDSNGFYVA